MQSKISEIEPKWQGIFCSSSRQLVETVLEGHENAKDAKKRLQEYKAKVVAEVNEESKELMRHALEQVYWK